MDKRILKGENFDHPGAIGIHEKPLGPCKIWVETIGKAYLEAFVTRMIKSNCTDFAGFIEGLLEICLII